MLNINMKNPQHSCIPEWMCTGFLLWCSNHYKWASSGINGVVRPPHIVRSVINPSSLMPEKCVVLDKHIISVFVSQVKMLVAAVKIAVQKTSQNMIFKLWNEILAKVCKPTVFQLARLSLPFLLGHLGLNEEKEKV